MVTPAAQLELFGAPPDAPAPSSGEVDVSTTFAANTKLPVHRWFRYSAGFSAPWVESVVRSTGARRVLDPFAGSGTTLLAAQDVGAEAIGVEAHPFVYRVAVAKLQRHTSPEAFVRLARAVRTSASHRKGRVEGYPELVTRCYPPDVLAELDVLRAAIEAARDDSAPWQLVWLALVGILRACSPVGTAQWQYVLPKKEKRSAASPFGAFDAMVATMAADMRSSKRPSAEARLIPGDARSLSGVPDGWADLVVTSPPYPNNYDYADATRLEMSFFREVAGWGDLQQSVRRHLVRACSQHVPEREIKLDEVLASPSLDAIRPPLSRVCEELAAVRATKGGKKTYHLMVACYFDDLARTWTALRRACAPGARVCFVIGDSAPYGVHVAVVDWMIALARAAGFRGGEFERTRDRNVKWKNRKHRVPLCEGRLWVDG